MKKIYLIILLLCWGTLISDVTVAQQSQIDSLEKALENIQIDTQCIDLQLILSKKYLTYIPTKSKEYAINALQISLEIDDAKRQVQLYNQLSELAWRRGETSQALSLLKKALQLAEENNDRQGQALAWLNYNDMHLQLQNYYLAIQGMKNAIDLFEQLEDPHNVIRCLNGIGWSNVLLARYDTAEVYFKKALPIAHAINSTYLAFLYDNLGELHFRKGDDEIAMPYLKKSLLYCDSFQNKRIESVVNRVLGEIHLRQNELDSAEIRTQKALELATELNAKPKMFETYKVFSQIMAVKQNYDQAYKYQRAYEKYRDSLLNVRANNNMQYFVYQQQQNEVIALKHQHEQEQIKRNTMLLVVAFFLIIAVVGSGILYRNRNKIQEAYQKLQKASQQISQKNEEIQQQTEEIQQQNQQLTQTLTNLQNTQSQLAQVERMASLGILTASVAHEINNPINYISGGIEALQGLCQEALELIEKYQKIEVENKPDLRKALAQDLENFKQEIEFNDEFKMMIFHTLKDMKTGTKRVEKVVKSLQLFSRLDEDEYLKTTHIHENLEAILLLLGNRFMGKVELEKHFAPQLSPIQCFPAQINQVFIHLLLNAEDALEGNGIIKVQTFENEEFVIIKIEDNGIGIPNEIQSNIFEPLFTTKTSGKNSGLGLTMSKQIVEAHQGKIEITSVLEKGTTVTVYLPKN